MKLTLLPSKCCILKCSNAALIRKFTWKEQRLLEKSLKGHILPGAHYDIYGTNHQQITVGGYHFFNQIFFVFPGKKFYLMNLVCKQFFLIKMNRKLYQIIFPKNLSLHCKLSRKNDCEPDSEGLFF